MDFKEFRALKARIAYKESLEQRPKCDLCEHCVFLDDRKITRRACMKTHNLIDNRVETCPEWCPIRR